ncbi:MAG: hypothetical protein LBC39_07660 [Methanobrevibacter sp.]|nr:hypothetical protein [Candidatus Methanovirga aequatorialis]
MNIRDMIDRIQKKFGNMFGNAFGGTLGCCCGLVVVLILLLVAACIIGSLDNHNSTNTTTTSTNKICEIENVNIYEEYFSIKLTGKIRWTDKDHYYASINGDAHLKDGTIETINFIDSWNDVKKDQWYNIDGSIYLGSNTNLEDVNSIEIKDNKNVIYIWNNK